MTMFSSCLLNVKGRPITIFQTNCFMFKAETGLLHVYFSYPFITNSNSNYVNIRQHCNLPVLDRVTLSFGFQLVFKSLVLRLLLLDISHKNAQSINLLVKNKLKYFVSDTYILFNLVE